MGSDLFAHFRVGSAGVQSAELAELAADAGSDSSGEADIVARLEPASRARQGEEIELWIDTPKVLFFDAEGGAAIRADGANGGGGGMLRKTSGNGGGAGGGGGGGGAPGG